MNNEPAFPGLHPSAECKHQDQGMTLRDYFAAKAMQGELASQSEGATWGDPDKLAVYTYVIADAMMRARGTE